MKHKQILFIVLALLQIAVPLCIAWQWENVLTTGELYRFRTAPLDPADALRGRYLYLNFKQMKAPAQEDVKNGMEAYACLGVDQKGYAEILQVVAEKPTDKAYIRVIIDAAYEKQAYFQLPFRSYYINETKALQLEKQYKKNASHAAALVRVKNGYAVLESLEGLE